MLRSSPFGWLPAHEPVAVRCGYDNLTHSVVGIFGRRAERPTRSKFSVQAVNIIDLQIAEPVMRTKRARVHVGRALAQHNPNAVPLDQSPVGGIRYAPQSIPWLVGLVITAAYWFTSSTSFANPAVKRSRFNHVATVCGWRPSTRAVCAIVRRACRRADATEHCGVLRLRS
jgi:hypothetical protein